MWPVSLLKNRSQKIAAAFALALTLSFALLGSLTVVLTDAALHRQVDQKISSEMERLVSLEKSGGLAALAAAQTAAETTERSLLFRFEDRNKNLVIGNFMPQNQRLGWSDLNVETDATAEQPDRFRVLTQVLGQGEISVASDLDEIENIRDTLSGAFITAGLVAASLALAGGMWFGHYNAKSINQLAATAEAIAAGDLTQRMIARHGEEGFDRLSATLNTMLDRNAELLEQQKRVTSEIAHDIRTPLTRLRQVLEQDGNDVAIQETDRLLDIFNSLLRIAELEEGARKAAFTRMDLSSLVAQIAEAYAANFEDTGRMLQVNAEVAAWVDGDKVLLLQLVSNLLENILAHTPAGIVAQLDVLAMGDLVTLSVTDNGPGIVETDITHIFKRFYRAGQSGQSQGNGLGLALVHAIAKLHGGAVKAERLQPGLMIVINLPNKKPG
jgi:signal transduction histidine kinase